MAINVTVPVWAGKAGVVLRFPQNSNQKLQSQGVLMITKDLCILFGLPTKAAGRSRIFDFFLGRGMEDKDWEMSPWLFSGTGELGITVLSCS